MDRIFDLPAAFPSLQAPMNFGQFGCVNLVCSEVSEFTRIKASQHLQKPNASQTDANGFPANRSGRL